MVGWALVAMAAFLCSGPVLRYGIKGRGYLLALAVAFAASWSCAVAIEMPHRRHNLTMFRHESGFVVMKRNPQF
jgi:hypothetical protein